MLGHSPGHRSKTQGCQRPAGCPLKYSSDDEEHEHGCRNGYECAEAVDDQSESEQPAASDALGESSAERNHRQCRESAGPCGPTEVVISTKILGDHRKKGGDSQTLYRCGQFKRQ
ncbi:hypothetical protein Sm713_58150 [Streptomyces sp. TS71-3]|nr:hypothetical protein Sm713_58150 [Streptomyces sp. TS71-3]